MNTEFWGNLESDIITHNTVPNPLYKELGVKRGLRNDDGSGVLAGLSQISSVLGSKKEASGLSPIEGELRYRGIQISDLVTEVTGESIDSFERVMFLLLIGRLPSDSEHQTLRQYLAEHYAIPDTLIEHLITAVPSPNIMNKLQTVVSALYTQDPNPETLDPLQNVMASLAVIAKVPAIVAYGFLAQYVENPRYIAPDPNQSIAENFLRLLRQGDEASDLEKRILDLCLLLHAEHGGGNNSTFTTYVVTSSGSDLYCTLAAAIASLKGPLHGAANKKVMEMMSDIKQSVKDWGNRALIRDYLAKIVKKEAYDGSGKLYGLGHAVYTKSDPRAVILKEKARELAAAKDRLDEFDLYCAIEEEGPQVFQEVKGSSKVIAPNVDFFSGFVYDCLGIPQEVYTPMFAMARSVGWSAHRVEEILSGKRVIRPGYKFVG